MGFRGPMRERGKESSAKDSLTRLLEFTSSWQEIQQHREAVPQTLRALGREGRGGPQPGQCGGTVVSRKSSILERPGGCGHKPRGI